MIKLYVPVRGDGANSWSSAFVTLSLEKAVAQCKKWCEEDGYIWSDSTLSSIEKDWLCEEEPIHRIDVAELDGLVAYEVGGLIRNFEKAKDMVDQLVKYMEINDG